MSKTKIFKIEKEEYNKKDNKNDLLSMAIGIAIYAFILIISSNLFTNFYIDNYFWAIIAAVLISALNYTIKPFLVFLTLPLTIITFGIAYPLVNMIILKICDLLMGDKFVISGFFSLFFIAIFISILKIILDKFITKNFKGSD
ncbi:MAG: phage holin family protein [Bacilli bacterium]|nr:phage holin family protein [Bacilli bacterium]